tara:strand:- start:4 stop:567 length:564 start_codon:yes stop_codon:yes gene_type:complete
MALRITKMTDFFGKDQETKVNEVTIKQEDVTMSDAIIEAAENRWNNDGDVMMASASSVGRQFPFDVAEHSGDFGDFSRRKREKMRQAVEERRGKKRKRSNEDTEERDSEERDTEERDTEERDTEERDSGEKAISMVENGLSILRSELEKSKDWENKYLELQASIRAYENKHLELLFEQTWSQYENEL